MVDVEKLDWRKRALDKERSRKQDQQRLETGEISHRDLSRENGFFAAFDLTRFRIAAIGGKPFGHRRR